MKDRSPTWFLIVMTTVASLALVGCSGDSKSKSSSTTPPKKTSTTSETSDTDLSSAAIGKKLVGESGFGADVEQCVGQAALDSLGKDGVRQAIATDKPTPKQAKAVGEALDKCATSDQIASTIVDELAYQANVTSGTDSLKACVSQKLSGKVGATFEAVAGSGSDDVEASKVLLEPVDDCPVTDFLTATIKAQAGTQGLAMSDQVVECIVGKLAPATKLSDLFTGGANFKDKATAAGKECAAGG